MSKLQKAPSQFEKQTFAEQVVFTSTIYLPSSNLSPNRSDSLSQLSKHGFSVIGTQENEHRAVFTSKQSNGKTAKETGLKRKVKTISHLT